MKMKKPKMYGGGMPHKKSKKGYKEGSVTLSDKKPHIVKPRGATDDNMFAKQFYIKGPGGKFIPVPKRMINKRTVAKKGGKV